MRRAKRRSEDGARRRQGGRERRRAFFYAALGPCRNTGAVVFRVGVMVALEEFPLGSVDAGADGCWGDRRHGWNLLNVDGLWIDLRIVIGECGFCRCCSALITDHASRITDIDGGPLSAVIDRYILPSLALAQTSSKQAAQVLCPNNAA